ncbi:zinc finger protein 90-like [Culicoides brevitarsis]|uniref:zinc finger protein 90-like n=1 Tax=Culicoides brevitarsis TaxID=469753 RepID=UPI00307B2EFA
MPLDTLQPCRICRKSTKTQEMHFLTDVKLKSMVETICGIAVLEEDFLCHGCVETISSSWRLRELAQSTPIKTEVEEEEESDEYEAIEIVQDDESLQEDAFSDDVVIEQPQNIEVDEEYLRERKIAAKKTVQCTKCRRTVKEIYLKDHEEKCTGRVRRYKCTEKGCDKQFCRPQSLKVHMNLKHLDKKPFECDFCGGRYVTKDSLKAHMVKHQSERNEECFVCGAKFKSKLSLYKHRIVHETKYVFCSICNAKFKSKYECNYHERIKHLGQKVQKKKPSTTFNCDECSRVYKTNDSLKRHIIRVHKKIKDFLCFVENCGARYGYHSSLKKHLQRVHPEIDLKGRKLVPDSSAKSDEPNIIVTVKKS